ncbi:MAG: hypothetical protein GXY76_23115 [Chloroflexi bacterium]|nr:hypothetical protein [Chloroflexota bacterium]
MPKYPQVKVKLVGEDGNAFAILGRVTKALRKGGVSREEVDAFLHEAMSGDYDHLLWTVMDWVDVDEPDDEDENTPTWEE